MLRHTSPDSLFHDPMTSSKNSLIEEFLFDKEGIEPHCHNAAELADLFLKRGEMRLLQGDVTGVRYFELASKLCPKDSKLFYDIGLSLFEFGSRPGKEKNLLKSARYFKTATQITPQFFEAWHVWGNALFLLGKSTGEHHYFMKAREKYAKALELKEDKELELQADLKWDNALVWRELAHKSEEALDLRVALDSFEKASWLNEKLPTEFWQDFGNCSIALAKQTNDLSLYQKGINSLKNAASLSLSSYDCWLTLGSGLYELYLYSLDDDTFTQANECFTTAAQLNPQDPTLWHQWASLLSLAGRIHQDPKKLLAAVDKCKRGLLLKQAPYQLLLIWSESLALIGQLNDNLAQIYEAQNKLTEAIELYSQLPELWLTYGNILTSLAHYFNDLDLFYQAIEKYQQGLSLDRTAHALWHAMAKCYTTCGEKEENIEDLELATRFYLRALDFKSSALYHLDYAIALNKIAEIREDEKLVEEAISHFESAFALQKNSLYLHPEWYFHYAIALDLLAGHQENDELYQKSLDILAHVHTVDPEFPKIHYRLGLVFGHYADYTSETDHFLRSLHHFRLANKREEEDDTILLDWGITCINFAEHLGPSPESDLYYQTAQMKLTESAKLGNAHAYYHLGCLFALLSQADKALRFFEKADNLDALPPFDHLQTDEWLDNLRSNEEFIKLMSRIENRTRMGEEC